jgi:hypothetical protein
MSESITNWVSRVTASPNPMVEYFIAGPYTDPDPAVKEFRYDALTRAYAQYVAHGHSAVCCITLTHPPDAIISQQKNIATLGSDYWTDADVPFMNIAKTLVVVKLPGWEKSSGTQKEIAYFRAQGKPILYIDPNEFILGKTQEMPQALPEIAEREAAPLAGILRNGAAGAEQSPL